MSHKIKAMCGVGFVDSNVYIITDEKTGFSAVVDPDFQYAKAENIIKEYDVKLILLTHAHFDHVASADELRKLTKAEIYVHEADKDACEDEYLNLSTAFGEKVSFTADKSFSDGEIISLGETEIKVLHTPGHTKGSSCFIMENDLISGDTLFNCSIGRTDFPGGSVSEMRESINKLKNLSGDYVVYPGHGSETTLSFEKENNPYFYSI